MSTTRLSTVSRPSSRPSSRLAFRANRVARALGVVASLVVGLSSAACATLRPQPPTVDFRSVALKDIALAGATIDVVLSVRNPNAFGIDIRRLAYSLYADSTLVGVGLPLERLQIPANDSSLVRLPVAFEYRNLGLVLMQLVTQGEVNYRVKGDVTFGTPIGELNRPFDAIGRFNARRGR